MTAKVRVAINGYGRIGRVFHRACLTDPRIQIVAINEPGVGSHDGRADPKPVRHLLKYDSVHRTLPNSIEVEGQSLLIDGVAIPVLCKKDPAQLDWKSLGVQVVLDASGVLHGREFAEKHRQAGAPVVVYSSTGKNPEDSDVTLVYGVNHEIFDPEAHHIIANASCTTNCLAPVCRILLNHMTLLSGEMCTIHAYTADQRLWDAYHSDLRRARAAARSVVPTSTGAAKAIGLVIPELAGKLDGIAYRVPTLDVSVIHLVADVDRDTTAEEVNTMFLHASEGKYRGIVEFLQEPLVSEDFVGNPHSAIVDAALTRVTGKRKVVVVAWYDNEWGYSCRLRDMILYIAQRHNWLASRPVPSSPVSARR